MKCRPALKVIPDGRKDTLMHGDVRQPGLTAETQPPNQATELSGWERCLQHPESLRLHRVLLQTHLWLGVVVGLYVLVMSVTGSMIVLRNELEQSAKLARRLTPVVEWLVNLHDDMLLGRTGRHLNGIGAICPDSDLRDRSGRLVAGNYALAAQLDGKSEIEFSARQLGSAQRAGIRVPGFF